MLKCNGKEVSLDGTNNDCKFYKSKVAELKKLKFPIVFKMPANDYRTRVTLVDENMNETGGDKWAGGFGVTTTAYHQSKDGEKKLWVYYETLNYDTKSGRELYEPRRVNLFGNQTYKMIFHEEDMDKLFYLVYISGHCEKIEGITGQNTVKKKTYLILDDREMQSKKKYDKRMADLKVGSYIYGPGDNEMTEDQVKMVAKAYGVLNVDTVNIEDVKNQLFEIVTKDQNEDAVDKFVESIEGPEEVKIKALISDAKTHRVIRETTDTHGTYWVFVDQDGKDLDKIITMRRNENKRNKVLLNHLLTHPNTLKAVKDEVESRMKN